MKNVHSTTPGFVLTSLSLRQTNHKSIKSKKDKSAVAEHPSSIIKFDYCLPPDEFNYFDGQDLPPSA